MDIENFKKLVKKYEPLHTDFVADAVIGERYYKNGSDILFPERKEDGEGNVMRNADNRIPRNFHGLIVNQKASYAFTVPPVFDIGTEEGNKRVLELLGDEYVKNCMELCVNAANTSVGWVHYWEDGAGFEWAVVDSKQIFPVWDKSLKQKLAGVLRVYGEPSADYRHGWGEVPFIPFFNNNVHTDDLKNIKKLVDVYDKVYSGFINDLDDVQEIILVLSGYGGTELNGFLQDLKKYKTIKLDEDEGNAGVSTLSIEIPIEARKTVLDITRRAIFEQGQGFDPQPESFGNQSGEALKFMYSLLEMKAGLMETEFRTGFAKLVRAMCRFCNIPCAAINQTWTRTRIKNDTELSEICKNSVGIVSCWTAN